MDFKQDIKIAIKEHIKDDENLNQRLQAEIIIDDIEDILIGDEYFITRIAGDNDGIKRIDLTKKITNPTAYDLLRKERAKNKELEEKLKDIKRLL